MFKLEISGYTFSCYLNGTLELAAADPGASFSSGKIGLQSGNQTYFDNVISYPGRKGFKFIPVATRLEIVSSPQTLAAGVASEPYSIEARYVVDTEDYVDTYCFDTMSISSSSLTGRFSADGISWSSANESPAALAYGQAEFYYRDLAAGTHTITVSRSGLIPDTQQAVVIDISETSSFLRVNTPAILADGTDNCTVVVTVQDSSGSPFPDQSVLFQTSRGAGYDSVSANPQTTDANGQCTFTVKSVYAGADTFTAVCKGIVILENILNNPSFELGIADPDNWIFSGDSWTWVSQESYSGSRAISGFTQASGDNYALATWAGLAPSDRYPVSPAGNYSASQMCRTDLSSGYAAIRLVWYNGSDTVGDADYAQVSGINTWTFQSALVTSPADANYVSYRSENRGAGTVWFDACMLRRVPTVNFNPTRLVIVTPQRTASVQEPTGIITVEAQDNAGIKDASFTGSTAGLSTSSAGGKFSFSCTYWEDVDHVSITDGSGSFYYKDIIEDSPVITVYRAGLAPDTQTVGVGPPVVSETASFFTINSGKIPADGKTPCTLTFYIKDKYGNALPGLQVTIFTARGSPPDTVAQPDLTDINGQCTATVISSNFGEDTFTGLCDGKVITLNLVSNPSMEEGTTSPEGWILNPNAATAALVRDTTVFTAGGASARISVTAVPSATSVIFYQQNLMLDRGIAYGVSFYAKCSKDKTGTADLTQQDTGANCGLDQNFSMGTSWDYYSFSFIASGSFIGDNINDACLKISTSQDISETITWWIDDVKFVRLPFANFTASRLVIDSPQRTAGAGIISDSITVEARDAAGARDTTFNNIFDLSSSFFSGRFSANRYTWIDTSIIRFSNGFAAFYYRDTSPGSPTITISSQGMQQDSQVFSVTQSAVCETTSYFRVYESRINADGITPCAVTVVISDINGNVIAGKEVTILTSRGTGIDSVTQPGLTDNNGQCTGFIVSLTLGPDTITAVCDGTTITENILNNPSFEQNFEGETMPSWWDFVGDNPGSHTGTWTWTQNEVYSGKRVMAHSCAAPADNYLQAQWSKPYRPAYPVYPVTPSTSFLVSQYAKTDLSSDMAGIRIIWWRNVNDTAALSEIRADSISAATAWTQLSKVVISPSEAHGILYRFQNWGVGTVWFDYARLSRIPTIEFVGPVEIAIITPPRTVFTGSASESIAIEVLDNFGEKAGTFNETVGLLSSSVSGRFSTDKFNWSTSNDSSITLGSGSGVFYYLDTAPNSPVITVYRQGLISDTQIVEVLASISASEAASYLRIVSPGTGSLPANGINQCRVAIFIRDSLGNPLSGRQVTIITSRGSAMDTITQPGLTDSNGQSTGTIVSSVPGQDTVVAFCEGVTITENVLPNPSFENGTGTPISWSYNTWTGSWSMVSDITYSGASAIRHTCASAGDNFTAPSANKSVIPGSAYRFTQYTKTDLSSGSAVIRIIWWDGGIVRGDVNSSGLSGNSDWTLLSALFSVPADAYQMEYRCMQGGVGTAWFDCVRASRVPTIEFTSADKLAIITPARTLVAGSVSESICVQAQMADGSKAANFNANCQFLSSNGLFCDTQTGETWSSSISLRVVDGETYVYYKGTKAGPSIITVKSPGLPDTTQVQLITPGVFSETASYIVISPRNPIGDGQNQCKIRVVVTDIYYNPIPGATVLITTSRKGTSEDTCDTITQPSQPTDENGMATGIVVSSLEGKDTITATVTGEPGKIIELTFFNSAPAGRWDFDEAGGDIAGSPANSGRLYGPTWAQGKYGSSLSFNGSTDYVSVPDTDSLDPQQISVELWFYRTGTTGDSWMINKVTDGAQGYRLGFGGDGYVAWHVPLTPWSHYFTSPYAVPLYQWTHVVGTSDGSKLRLYVNGVETATLDRIGGINPSSGDLYIGSYGGGGGYNFPGLLDGVRIYNKALSAEEVRADYEGRRKKPITWAAASKIAFLTPPRTIVAGSASESIVVQAQWSDGSKADNYNEDCEFSSSSPTGRFSAAPGGENWASSLTLRFVSGETYVFFKDIKPGSYTLTVRSGSLSETTQAQYVNLGDFSETASYIIVGSRNAGIDGITPCPVIAVVTDRCRNPVPGKTVVITTSRKGTADDAYDTITYPNGQVTDTNGWCTGLLVSTLPGKDTITAYLLGDSSKTIKNTIFKDNLLAGGWNFDEGEGTAAYDVSPYKNNGSLTGSPAWASGYYGSGLEFTGTGNYVTIPDTDSLHFSDELTAELWLKRVGEGTWLMYIDKSNSFQLRRDPLPPTESGNFTSFVVIGAGWEPRVNSGIQPGAGIWYHVVTTYDKNAGAGNLKIYVNGEFKASSTRTGSIDSTSNPVNIGTSWPGVIDEVRLYNKALPADEIVASYEGRQKPITFRILATQLKITNSPFKAKSGQAVPVTVVAEDGVGNVDSNFNEAANLLTSSESGSFSLTQNWVNINTVTLTNGSAAFYYRDYLIGSPVITITHSGLTPAAQQETITASKLQFLSPPFVISSIQASDTIAVVARDESGNTDTGWNETASLKSTSSKGRFSLGRESWSDTSIIRFSSGSIVFFYKDSRGGAPVITITSSDIISSQKETIVMPVILLEKFVRNEQLTGQDTQTIVLLSAGDTLEFRLKISNVGGETAINLIITDTITFNTAVYTPVAFLSMDSETIADSWTYAADPAGAIWEPWNSSPPAGAENIKGLRWGINTLGVNEQRSIKFRVRVK